MGIKRHENIIRSKYKEPTPVQKYAIPMILGGRDVMGCAQTGSGKTAAYLIPIVQRLLQAGVGGRSRSRQACPEVVIMSPTRELAIQIKDEARKFCNGSDIQCMVVYGVCNYYHIIYIIHIAVYVTYWHITGDKYSPPSLQT